MHVLLCFLIFENPGITQRYNDSALNGANPVLKNGLIPVTITNDGVVKKTDFTQKWYNYTNKEWTNAVVLKNEDFYNAGDAIAEENIKQYYVWVPRYRYQLWNVDGENRYPNGTEKESAINIAFEDSCKCPKWNIWMPNV